MSIVSKTISLKEIVDKDIFFNVPIYQRLYVWEEDQVKTLLEDIETAFDDKKEIFFLGGVLVVEHEKIEKGVVYDLIDGQQRFTTLWMISLVFQDSLAPFIEREEVGRNRHRVVFSIRDDVYQYFRNYIGGLTDGRINPNIDNALAFIATFKQAIGNDKVAKIARFIYEKVQLIFTEVPKETDLNKLFEIINNRGVQLQHHEILKAKLLAKVDAQQRFKYGCIWDACAYMESYVEKNIRDILKLRIQDLFENDAAAVGAEKLRFASNILELVSQNGTSDSDSWSLGKILSEDISDIKIEEKDEEMYEADEVRSIISFPMLLQHTLRIFLAKNNKQDISKILDKELLNIFDRHFLEPKDVTSFIELLWEVRYVFDKHVIKWVRLEDGETHLICGLEKYENKGNFYLRRIQRDASVDKGEALLQSFLYHSQQITTQYWLTPYLKYLIDNKDGNSYHYLKHLDNHLFCSGETESLIVRTRKFLDNFSYSAPMPFDISLLSVPLGTAFPHYWFYKLEFVLWSTLAAQKDQRWRNFKFTAKNSVEHISPQTQKDTDTNTVSADMLDCFGNLSLVSRSINSEYSNLPYNEKRQRFINNNHVKLDSLKMQLIYENEVWNDTLAGQHQKEMIKYLEDYLATSYI